MLAQRCEFGSNLVSSTGKFDHCRSADLLLLAVVQLQLLVNLYLLECCTWHFFALDTSLCFHVGVQGFHAS